LVILGSSTTTFFIRSIFVASILIAIGLFLFHNFFDSRKKAKKTLSLQSLLSKKLWKRKSPIAMSMEATKMDLMKKVVVEEPRITKPTNQSKLTKDCYVKKLTT
jgi:FtsZ-interacting cell division protein ZipA